MRFFYYSLALALALACARPAAAQAPLNDTVAIDKEQFNLFNPTPRKYMRPLVPDRPGITESPYSVDAGHFQYETDALRLLMRREGPAHGHDWYANHFLAKIGLTNRTDFQVALDSYTYSYNTDDTDPSQDQRTRGIGDVTLRLKHTLVGDDNSRWALGLIGYVQLPSGGAVGDGGYEPGLALPVVYQFTKAWSAGGQVAANYFFDREQSQHYLQLTPTLTTDYQFNKLVQAFVELVGYWDVRQASWRSSINVGPQFDVTDNLQVDFGAHLPVTHSVDREYFLGLTFRR
ncbi:transporter [Hymenobacter sp. H14-R3]|uniref:transporter n=1 Tax=Hymenobacter sp. H14-R3 TaxID=3046308 RepID=UPI0024BBCBF4|nr:transporter [Hymenobacter sp. H14-R3]MDJ0365561.1 transporter [Hymenobacter sp. H14-R3]